MTGSTIQDVAATVRFRNGNEFIVTAASLPLLLLHMADEDRARGLESITVSNSPGRHISEVRVR